jgi:hypothetical protein
MLAPIMVIVVVSAVSVVAKMSARRMIPTTALTSGMVRMPVGRYVTLMIRESGLAQCNKSRDRSSEEHALFHSKSS